MVTAKSEKLISVIIPVYNAELYLNRCVESVLRQSSRVEIILVDDGSKDNSGAICDELSLRHGNVKVIHCENGGVSKARNIGIEEASGEYIAFVDADDILADDMLNVLQQDLEETQSDISCVGYTEIEIETGNRKEKFGTKKQYTWDDPLKEFLTDNKITWMVWGKLYRKELIGDVRFPVGKAIAEDMYFIYRLCRKAKRVTLRDESFYQYMIHNDSALRQEISDKDFDTPKLVEKVYTDTIKDLPEYLKEANTFRLRYSIWFYRTITKKSGSNKKYTEAIIEIRKIICQYSLAEAKDTQTKKYFLEYLMIKRLKNIYEMIIKM